MMCLEFCSEMNIGMSIKSFRIHDVGRFISMKLGNYYKEVGIERACSVMPS
jgi:uncharacterized protein (DUF2164 family)